MENQPKAKCSRAEKRTLQVIFEMKVAEYVNKNINEVTSLLSKSESKSLFAYGSMIDLIMMYNLLRTVLRENFAQAQVQCTLLNKLQFMIFLGVNMLAFTTGAGNLRPA